MLVTWELSEEPPSYSNATFSIYFGTGGSELLAGTTGNFSMIINGLTLNVNYTIRVELRFAFSTQTLFASTNHVLKLTTQTTIATTTDTNIGNGIDATTGILIGVIVFLLVLLAVNFIAFVAAVCIIKSGIPIKKYLVNKSAKNAQKVGAGIAYETMDIPLSNK